MCYPVFQNSTESGPETEAIELGTVGDHAFAFAGIERGSAIFVYDVLTPRSAEYVQTVVNRDFSVGFGDSADDTESNPDSDRSGRAGDWGPEGLEFISVTGRHSGRHVWNIATDAIQYRSGGG